MYAFGVLQIGNDLKQVARLRVAAGAEHAHQTFCGAMGCVAPKPASRTKRDFSLRRPTTSQERSGKKRRRPAALEMTVWHKGSSESALWLQFERSFHEPCNSRSKPCKIADVPAQQDICSRFQRAMSN